MLAGLPTVGPGLGVVGPQGRRGAERVERLGFLLLLQVHHPEEVVGPGFILSRVRKKTDLFLRDKELNVEGQRFPTELMPVDQMNGVQISFLGDWAVPMKKIWLNKNRGGGAAGARGAGQ